MLFLRKNVFLNIFSSFKEIKFYPCLYLFTELFQDLSQLQETWLAEGKGKKTACKKRKNNSGGGKKSPELAVLMFSPIN